MEELLDPSGMLGVEELLDPSGMSGVEELLDPSGMSGVEEHDGIGPVDNTVPTADLFTLFATGDVADLLLLLDVVIQSNLLCMLPNFVCMATIRSP